MFSKFSDKSKNLDIALLKVLNSVLIEHFLEKRETVWAEGYALRRLKRTVRKLSVKADLKRLGTLIA